MSFQCMPEYQHDRTKNGSPIQMLVFPELTELVHTGGTFESEKKGTASVPTHLVLDGNCHPDLHSRCAFDLHFPTAETLQPSIDTRVGFDSSPLPPVDHVSSSSLIAMRVASIL